MGFECLPNCGECCGIVPINKIIFEKNKARQQVEVRNIINVDKTEVYPITQDEKCVFLNRETKKCMIYEDRPKICKDYGLSTDNIGLMCPYLKANGNPRSPAKVKQFKRQLSKWTNAEITKITNMLERK